VSVELQIKVELITVEEISTTYEIRWEYCEVALEHVGICQDAVVG